MSVEHLWYNTGRRKEKYSKKNIAHWQFVRHTFAMMIMMIKKTTIMVVVVMVLVIC